MGQKITVKIKKYWRKKNSTAPTRNAGPENNGFFHSEPIKRAFRTFIQAAAGFVVVNAVSLDFSAKNAVKGFIISAIAAGIAAVMNIDYNNSDYTGGDTT